MNDYYKLLDNILNNGNLIKNDRTGTGTLSLFGEQVRFNLQRGFPLCTGKFTPFKLVASELLWFISGSTNNNDLRKLNQNNKDTIWEEWATESGDLGPIYGNAWRSWKTESGTIDQLSALINGLKSTPFSRRHIINSWNVGVLPDESISPQDNVKNGKACLGACHTLSQFYCRELKFQERLHYSKIKCDYIFSTDQEYMEWMDKNNVPKYGLSCHLYQRSCDTFLGLPFNIASYALFTHMIGNVVNMVPDTLTISFGDCHLYLNHIEQANELLIRSNQLSDFEQYDLPVLIINKTHKSLDEFTLDSFKIEGYKYHPSISAPIAI
jgi:thymidylate synthase